ncbi:MAG: FliH/SctL family protein [Thiomicrorhabdus sp.]|nr:FliH/SctL family protein [Thiomicrorhabdus sp.]
MVDSKSKNKNSSEESVLTKLVSSSSVEEPKIETWQMHDFNEKTTESTPEFSEKVLQKAEKRLQPELQKKTDLLKKDAYDAAYKEGYQAGFAKGFEQGCTEGLEKQEQIFAPKLIQFEQILEMLQAPYQKIEKKALSDLVALSLHISKRVIKTEVAQDKKWILKAVEEAVKLLPDDSAPIKVELHPDDLQLLKELKSEITDQWQLKANAELVLGTCLIKQQNSSILNSWQDRFDEISNDLLSRTEVS